MAYVGFFPPSMSPLKAVSLGMVGGGGGHLVRTSWQGFYLLWGAELVVRNVEGRGACDTWGRTICKLLDIPVVVEPLKD